LPEVVEEIEAFAERYPITEFGRQPNRPSVHKDSGFESLNWAVSLPMAPFRVFKGVDVGAQAIQEFAGAAQQLSKMIESYPQKLRWQVDLLLLDLDQTETLVTARRSMDEISQSVAQTTQVLEHYPEDIRGQIEVLLKDIETRQLEFQKTLEVAQSTLKSVDTSVAGVSGLGDTVERTATELQLAGKSWTEAIGALHLFVTDVSGPVEKDPNRVPGKPFDILDYAVTAERLTEAAKELRELFGDLQASQAFIDSRIDLASQKARGLVLFTTTCTVVVILVFFACALGYRRLRSRMETA